MRILLITIAILITMLFASIANAIVLGVFHGGDTFDTLTDGTYLVFEGRTVDGTVLVTRKIYDQTLNYNPIPMGNTVKPFSWILYEVKYTFSLTLDKGLTISR